MDPSIHREAMRVAPLASGGEAMRNIIAAGLVVLVAACSEGSNGNHERPIQYGAAQAPTMSEEVAAGAAQTTLAGSLTFQPSSEPTYGAPGLADELVANLGGYGVAAAMLTTQSANLAGRATVQAIDTGGMDPACVTTTESSVTWTGCHVEMMDVDPYTGDTTSMTVDVSGVLGWNAATGRTTWDIHETMTMAQTQGGDTMTMNATVDLGGSVTVTASRIVGNTGSSATVRANYMGMPVNQGVQTTLAIDLGYQADPFCITSGTLVVEQRWTERPMGGTPETMPDQGWRFAWTGCNQLTVAHGMP